MHNFIYTIKERGSASHVIIKIILGAYIVDLFLNYKPFPGQPFFRAQKSDESRSQL